MQAGWQLCNNKSDLEISMIRVKHKCGNDTIPRINIERYGSDF